MIGSNYMVEFLRQTEWVEKRGFFLVLAFFLGGLGGGLYLVSLYFDFYVGLVTGFLIVVVGKGISHLIYLGRPWRFWRGFLRPQSSWISRGLIAVAMFAIFGALQLAPSVPQLSWLPWSSHNAVIQTLAIISAVALITYTGFALGAVNAIPFWNTALMPVLFIACSSLGGSGLAMALLLGTGHTTEVASLEKIVIGLLITVALLIGIYLWVSNYGTPASKTSVREMTRGKASPYFIGGVVVLGLAIPLGIAICALFYKIPATVLLLGVAGEFIGGFCVRYSIMKAGVYAPLV